MSESELTVIIKEEISKETKTPVSEIDAAATFYSVGLDSISAVFVMEELQNRVKVELNPMFFWDYPTIASLARHISTMQS
jgi:acyl carrier protein